MERRSLVSQFLRLLSDAERERGPRAGRFYAERVLIRYAEILRAQRDDARSWALTLRDDERPAGPGVLSCPDPFPWE